MFELKQIVSSYEILLMRIDNLKKMWVCDPYAIEHESWFRSRAVREANQQWKIMRKSLRCVNQVGVVKKFHVKRH